MIGRRAHTCAMCLIFHSTKLCCLQGLYPINLVYVLHVIVYNQFLSVFEKTSK